MPPTRRRYLATAAGAIVLAGCQSGPDETDTENGNGDGGSNGDGDSNGDGNGGAPDATTPTDGGGAATVAVREHPDYGEILVDGEGLTLYMFDSDTQGSGESTCSGGCLSNWPALTTAGEPTADDGVTATLSTFDRGDGDTQVAANGWPLYYFAQDSAPGDVTGQAVNDVWWVLDPAGQPIRSTGTATEDTSDSGLGY